MGWFMEQGQVTLWERHLPETAVFLSGRLQPPSFRNRWYADIAEGSGSANASSRSVEQGYLDVCGHPTHMLHVWNIYQHLPKNHPNVDKYSIHGASGQGHIPFFICSSQHFNRWMNLHKVGQIVEGYGFLWGEQHQRKFLMVDFQQFRLFIQFNHGDSTDATQSGARPPVSRIFTLYGLGKPEFPSPHGQSGLM